MSPCNNNDVAFSESFVYFSAFYRYFLFQSSDFVMWKVKQIIPIVIYQRKVFLNFIHFCYSIVSEYFH